MMASLSVTGGHILRAVVSRSSPLRPLLTYASTTSHSKNSNTSRNSQTSAKTYSRSQNAQKSQIQIPFEEDLKKRNDLDSSLQLLKARKLDPAEAAKLIRHISEMVKSSENAGLSENELDKLLNDKRFDQLSNVLHNQVDRLVLPILLSSVESLLKMSAEDFFLTKSLEMQIIWLLRSASISDIVKVLVVHKNHEETSLRREVQQQCIEQLTARLSELTKPQDLLTLMYTIGDSHTELLKQLEHKAMDLCESMTEKELFRVMSLLSQKKRRNKPLLTKVVHALSKTEFSLTVPQVQNLLFSCSNLQVYDEELLGKITEVILANEQEVEDIKTASSLLQCFSNLRWRHEELLETLSEVVIDNLYDSKTYDLLSLLLTCAHLNFLPRILSNRLEDVLRILSNLSEVNPRQWVDVVWSCVVLEVASPDMVASVLEKTFSDKIQGSTEITNIKLRNIASAARYEVHGYEGPIPKDCAVTVPVRLNRLALGSVLKALSSLAPAEKYLEFDVSHRSGFNVDVDLTVDSKGKPVPKDSSSEPGFFRLAIKVLDYPDMTLNSVRPTGLHSMAIRHLGYHGYHVIEVQHNEFGKLTTEVQRVQYLEKKINSIVNPDASKS